MWPFERIKTVQCKKYKGIEKEQDKFTNVNRDKITEGDF